MSDDDVRRPRRIIMPPVPADARPAPPPLPPQRQAERFQRVMQQGRRFDLGVERASSRQAAAGAAPRGDAASGPEPKGGAPRPPAAGARVLLGARSEAYPVAEAVGAASSGPWPGGDPVLAGQAAPPGDGRAFGPGPAMAGWDADLVRVIVTLCVNTDPAIEAWTVVVPLNERVLPQTALHLTLSRHSLALRFHTQSSQSLNLLSTHRPSLVAMLHQALPGDREIDIDLT